MQAGQAAAAQEAIVGMVGMAFLVLYGVVQIFFGYRLMRFVAKVHAALLLGAFAFGLCGALGYTYTGIGVGLLLAIVGYKLGDIYYYLNMIALGLIAGGALGYVASLIFMAEPNLILPVVGAIAGAVLTVMFERPLVILLTSALGSVFVWFGAIGAQDLQSIQENGPDIGPLSIGVLALGTLLGLVIQARTTKNLPDRQIQNESAAVKQ